MTDDLNETAPKRSKRGPGGPWIVTAAVLAFSGIAIMFIGLILTAPRFVNLIGLGVFAVSAVPYLVAMRLQLLEAAAFREEIRREALDSLHESQVAFLAAQDKQLQQMQEITAKILATTRVYRLERIEEEVHAEILGVDPDDVLAMEWPKDGLRDSVIVYFTEGPAVTYPLTIDQMNQAAETINQRMDQHDRGDSQP